jgi:hypothetical protein
MDNKTLANFGITEEIYNKTKNILPTFDIGKLEVNSKVILRFLEDMPKEVEVVDVFALQKGQPKDSKIKSRALSVHVDTVFRAERKGILEVAIDQDMTLWLSSKTLSIGIARLYEQLGHLKDVKACITIGEADFRMGKNRAYSVMQVA